MKNKLLLSMVLLGSGLFVASCGPKAFVKGEYDKDVTRENLLNDQWSESDMQVVVKDMVASLLADPALNKAGKRPVIMVTGLQNKTSEHIDTQSIMDMIRVELQKSKKVAFVDREARKDVADEYDYQNSGMVTNDTKKAPGGQIGSDFIVNGRLDSITQEAGNRKSVYYKLTLNLTDLKSNIIEWTDQKEIRKLYKKRSVGL